MEKTLPAGNKQIIICCDGTNNTLTAHVHDTNVLKIYQHLAAQQRPEQLLYYDPGVGAPDALPSMSFGDGLRNKINRLWGLASGRGIYENMAQAYLFLMKHYQPGDQIYLFGFSRGAFTVRCLSGMVHLFGILNAQHETLLPTLLRVYFSDTKTPGFFSIAKFCKRMLGFQSPRDLHARQEVADQIRETFCDTQRKGANIHFIGVWDTVASVGLPGMGPKISSTGTIQNKRIRHVRHALALDEHRLAYQPRLYKQNNFGDENSAQSMFQLWFPGNHCDVGGGHPQRATTKASETYQSETLLSDQAWEWMQAQAIACGLIAQPLKLDSNRKVFAHDQTYVTPWWMMLGVCQRKMIGKDMVDQTLDGHPPLQIVTAPRTVLGSFSNNSEWNMARDGMPLVLAALGSLVFVLLFDVLMNYGFSSFNHSVQATKTFFHHAYTFQQDQLFAAWKPNALLEYRFQYCPYSALWIAETGLLASIVFLLSRWLGKAFAYRLAFTLPRQSDGLAKVTGNALMIWAGLALLENSLVTSVWYFSWPALGVLVSIVAASKWLAFIWLLISCLSLSVLPKKDTSE
jgi:hypothetical protein